MNAAIVSVVALVVAIALSLTSHINVGILSIVFAWLIGVYVAGLRVDAVVAGFPSQLFVTLTGVTLLFALAQSNGALEQLTRRVVRLGGRNAGLLPLVFFVLALGISTVGPGAIATVALLAPMAMPIGARAGVSNFLTALMVANGANAGNLSPFSAGGVIANTVMERIGLGGNEWRVWAANFAAHALVSLAAYAFFGGWRLLTARASDGVDQDPPSPLERRHVATYAVIVAWMAAVMLLKVPVGLAAFAAVALLVLLRTSDEADAVKRAPWYVILMVCGVTTLVALLEQTGGLDLFSALLARLATPATAAAVVGFLAAVISVYSSTTGVVLPALLPTVPGIVQQLGGGDPLSVALSINVGSSLVDVSPLSTLGALCVAAVAAREEARTLFRALMVWGLAMTVVGAVFCYVFIEIFAAR